MARLWRWDPRCKWENVIIERLGRIALLSMIICLAYQPFSAEIRYGMPNTDTGHVKIDVNALSQPNS